VAPNDYTFETIVEAQASLDVWVDHYNTERPHQSLGMMPPAQRFALTRGRDVAETSDEPQPVVVLSPRPAGVSRWVDQRGSISLARFRYRVGPSFAGEPVEVVCHRGLVEILHAGVVVATHAQRRPADPKAVARPPSKGRARAATSGPSVLRMADSGGSISFAGTAYRAGRSWARRQITVAIVGASVQLSVDGKVIRVHPIRHDRTKEHGAFATPHGRPRKARTA
jgi:hypothetical protein